MKRWIGFSILALFFSQVAHAGCADLLHTAQISLNASEMTPFLSPYLDGHVGDDQFKIESLQIDGVSAHSIVNMVSTYGSPTDPGGFHLSAIVALQIVSQIAIVHGQLLLGYERKQSEVWMKGIGGSQFNRPIRKTQNIQVDVMVLSSRSNESKNLIFLIYEYSFESGSFIGTFELAYEIPNTFTR